MTPDGQPYIASLIEDHDFLRAARSALIAYPKEWDPSLSVDAPFNRLVIMLAYSVIEERIFRYWQSERFLAESYFSSDKNTVKIRSLNDAFKKIGLPIDAETIEDFLAIKYLRNSLIHFGWKFPHEEAHVRTRGFPTDPTELGAEHWQRISTTLYRMITHVGEAVFLSGERDDHSWEMAPHDFAYAYAPHKNLSAVLIGKEDLPRLYRHNMERISQHLAEETDHTDDGADERLRLRAIAIESWAEYYRLTLSARGVTVADMQRAAIIDEHIFQHRMHPNEALLNHIENEPGDADHSAIVHRPQWESDRYTSEEIVFALRTSSGAYRYIRGNVPARLLLEQVPRIEPRYTQVDVEHAHRALLACRLSHYWHCFREAVNTGRAKKPDREPWRSYEMTLERMRATARAAGESADLPNNDG